MFHDVSTPYVGKCGGYRGWNRDGSLGSCVNRMCEMGKDLVGTHTRLCPLGKALQWCASIFPDLANRKLGKVISSYSYQDTDTYRVSYAPGVIRDK